MNSAEKTISRLELARIADQWEAENRRYLAMQRIRSFIVPVAAALLGLAALWEIFGRDR